MTDTKDKLCPFRIAALVMPQNFSFESEAKDSNWALCLEDKCQMWRETRDGLITNFGYNEKKDAICYCGLAGKP
jgi:hypothetical protein